MRYLIGMALLAVFVLLLYRGHKRAVSEMESGKKWYVIVLFWLSGVAGLIAALLLWAPAANLFVRSVAGLTGYHPLIPALIFAGMAGSVVFGIGYVMYRGLKKVGVSGLALKIVIALLFGLWAYGTINLIGVSDIQGNVFFLSAHLFLGVFVLLIGIPFLRRWETEEQNRWAIPLTYVVCWLLTAVLCGVFGYSVVSDIKGSLVSTSFFLVFNLVVFWLTYVVGRKRDMKQRASYLILYTWMLVLFCSSGYLVLKQGMHRLTIHELLSLRASNTVNLLVETLKRERANYGLSGLLTQAKEAKEKGDLKKLVELQKKINAIDARQRLLSHTAGRLPQTIEDDIKGIKKAMPWNRERKSRNDSANSAANQQERAPKWWRHAKVIPPHESLLVVKVGNGDTLKHYANKRWGMLEESKKQPKILDPKLGIATSEFFNIRGLHKVWLTNPNDTPMTVFYAY